MDENKINKFNFDPNAVRRSADDAKGKIEELMNDEELKEAFRKLKDNPNERKDYVAPNATAKEKK